MSELVLEMQHVTKKFPGVIALNDVSLALHKGEILGICGENGAGKSTLMKVLSGSYPAGSYEGNIIIDGEIKQFTSVRVAQQCGIEMVYQENNMILDVSIAENLFVGNLPNRFGWVSQKRLCEKSQEILKKIGVNANPKMKVRYLNSGQMQLLSLMRAAVKNPKIFVLDEPTTALTAQETNVMMKLLQDMRSTGVSCLYISHKLDELYSICDKVLVLRDGQTVSSHDMKDVSKEQLIEEMVGRKLENTYPKEIHAPGDEVLRVESLSVPHPNIHGKNIVNDISFSVKQGEILGIGGLVGAGRSECLGAIFGQFVKNVKKRVYLNGQEVSIRNPRDAINLGFGFITEERKFNGITWMHSIKENMTLPCLSEITGRVFINRKKETAAVSQIMEKLRIKAPSMETKLVQLSGGNQQKVILGKWLLSGPKVLLVDEPTKGIDVATKAEFYQIMSDLTKSGVTIVMVSSDLPELMAMSDRVIVIANGRITAELRRENQEITETNIMRAAIME